MHTHDATPPPTSATALAAGARVVVTRDDSRAALVGRRGKILSPVGHNPPFGYVVVALDAGDESEVYYIDRRHLEPVADWEE